MTQASAIIPDGMDEAEHFVLETAASENIMLGSEPQPAEQPLSVRERIVLRDGGRGTATELTFYDQGCLKLTETRRRKTVRSYRVNLRYLDPAPTITEHGRPRVLWTALGLGATAALAGVLAALDVLAAYTLPAAVVAAAAAIVAALLAVYLTHSKIVFRTLHGRSAALVMRAGFGCGRKYRAVMPTLIDAIEEAGETIGEDTIMFLRQEMREHYRLRGDGVLTPEECSTSTERILAEFDSDL